MGRHSTDVDPDADVDPHVDPHVDPDVSSAAAGLLGFPESPSSSDVVHDSRELKSDLRFWLPAEVMAFSRKGYGVTPIGSTYLHHKQSSRKYLKKPNPLYQCNYILGSSGFETCQSVWNGANFENFESTRS